MQSELFTMFLLLLLSARSGRGIDSPASADGPMSAQCQSLESARNETVRNVGENRVMGCRVLGSCSGIECRARVGEDSGHRLLYGIDFNSFCSVRSDFTFYWNFHQTYTRTYNVTTSIYDSIDVSNDRGERIAEEILIQVGLVDSKGDRLVLSVQVTIKISSKTSFDLVPPRNLTFAACPEEPGEPQTTDGSSSHATTVRTEGTTHARIDTGRACNGTTMGDCRDEEICRPVGGGSARRCFCFDGYDLDTQGSCVPSQLEKPDNPNILWGTLGGLAVTVVLAVMFAIIIRRQCRRSRRYNEFDLSAQDPSLPDPPMLEA